MPLVQIQNDLIDTDKIERAELDNEIPAVGEPPTVKLVFTSGDELTFVGEQAAWLWQWLTTQIPAENVFVPSP